MNDLAKLLKKDGRVLLNLRRLASEQSVFKGLVIGVFGGALLAGLFWMFLDAFRFLGALGGIGLLIIQRLFGLFFFGLGLMLVLSNIITAYAVFFRADDVPFLLLQPLRRGALAMHKLFESALLSSWAFFLIMIPFVSAFAWHQKLPLSFGLWTMLFSIPFVVFCSGLGAILIMLAARWLPRFKLWIWFGLLAAGLGALWFWQAGRDMARGDDISFMLARLVPGLQLASFPLWPSWWVSEGIMAMVRARWLRGALLFSVLAANALFIVMLAETVGQAVFHRAWERVAAGAARGARPRAGAFQRLAAAALILPAEYRAVLLKDIRSLLRDPTQMIQGLLFFGLLGIYFFNLRNLHYHLLPAVWRNLIAFLNLFSLATIMASFCSRFVFPQISLEGQAFWLIGLSPTGLGRVLKIKYLFSVLALLLISAALMTVSTIMLGGQAYVLLITVLAAIAMSFALSGLALGLGAVFLDLKQKNPVAIISGFGGTFNLVLSLVYIMAAIIPFGALAHAYTLGRISRPLFLKGIAAGSLWLGIITALAAGLPLLLGARSLARREF